MREFQPEDKDEQQASWRTPQVERLYIPAMLPLGLIKKLRHFLQRRRVRRRTLALLAYDDHILCDLGFSRGQLRRQLGQPVPRGIGRRG